jgi:hypothetical protein
MIMESLSIKLKCKNSGLFKNKLGDYCEISSYYIKNTRYFMVIFAKPGEIAKRFAIKTTSEKKVLKLIETEGFELV